ncbi:MAG TPA: DinB family protein [Bacillales bacterium]|nr:DinB family protein [Bacillales bacterium]
MERKKELLAEFAKWKDDVVRYAELDWSKPVAPGKWTIHGLVSHMLKWDEFFLENAIEPITKEEPLDLGHADFDTFNREAVAYGEKLSKEELLEKTLHVRDKLIEEIEKQEASQFAKVYEDLEGRKISVERYLEDMIEHDRHHAAQIQAVE